jgi:hypothetical protein
MRRLALITVPAAIAAAFLALPAWSASSSSDSKNAAPTRQSERAVSGASSAVQNHTQGDVDYDCLREDARKHPADIPCSKTQSMRHPKEHTASSKEKARTASR